MKIIISLFCLLSFSNLLYSQEFNQSQSATEEQVAERTIISDEIIPNENDDYIQALVYLKSHPINLNSANEKELNELGILSQLQIQSFLNYRKLIGMLISFFELQSIPNWNNELIYKLQPYVKVSIVLNLKDDLKKDIKSGNYSLLIRSNQSMQVAEGYKKDSVTGLKKYQGSPQGISMRFLYQYKNNLRYGLTLDKDPGENLFHNKHFKGFDFYSAHVFIRDVGLFKSIAIGDYTVNVGQGLIQWQTMSFKKGADVLAIKHQSETLKPYNSFGEYNFHRGIGFTIEKKNLELTLFGSLKKIDANEITDSVFNNESYISAIQTSGLHRTLSELSDKSVQTQKAYGGRVSMHLKNGSIGFNSINYQFNLPIQKNNSVYNIYAFNEKKLSNFSIDYSLTNQNFHSFGEMAVDNQLGYAVLNGILLAASPKMDISLVYRNISKNYHSQNANAFTENSTVENEIGFYTGISLRPKEGLQLNAYMDFFKSPWLKYQINAPGVGIEYLLQGTYKYSKKLFFSSQFKLSRKKANQNIHSFGELAANNQLGYAFFNGILIAASPKMDISFVYRNISKNYHTQNANAFTENAVVENETGFYTGISLRPKERLQFNAYMDFFKSPWLKYQINAPSNGIEYLLQGTYKYSKKIFFSSQFKLSRKNTNQNQMDAIILPLGVVQQQNLRLQVNFSLSHSLSIRNRIEFLSYEKSGLIKNNGYLLFIDCYYKPMMKPFSANARLLFFDTDNYSSRIYAYESDLPYFFSIPSFYGNGLRLCLNLNYDVNKNCSFWLKWDNTVYYNQSFIGTASEQIKGNKNAHLKAQILIRF